MNEYFDITRLYFLLKRQFVLYKRNFLIAAGAIAGIIFLILLMIWWNSPQTTASNDFHIALYSVFLFIGGYIVTSIIFTDLGSPEKGYAFLMIPASTLEKFFSMLLFTTIGWVIGITAVYYIFMLLVDSINVLITGNNFDPVNLFKPEILKAMGYYCLTQSIFFLGAAVFKKNALVKTLLSIFLFSIGLSIITGVFMRLFFYEYFQDGAFHHQFNGEISPRLEEFFTEDLGKIIKIIFHYIMAPLFWFIAYLRLKETEI